RHQGDPTAQYAYALLLNSADQPQAARASLATVPRAQWDGAMHELDQALELRLLQAEAERLRTAGDKEAAYRLWAQLPETPDTQAQLGQWLHEDGRLSDALAQYESVLAAEPERANIRLAQWRVWQEQGQLNTLRQGLRAHELESTQLDAYDWANWAELWQQVGEPQQAKRVLENAIAQPDTIDPLLYRDLSRLERRDTPQQALTHLAA